MFKKVMYLMVLMQLKNWVRTGIGPKRPITCRMGYILHGSKQVVEKEVVSLCKRAGKNQAVNTQTLTEKKHTCPLDFELDGKKTF